METRNHYWVLDCILTLTAVVLAAAALCSFAGIALPPQSGIALAAKAVLCGVVAWIGLLFAALVRRDHHGLPLRGAVRLHQQLHAMMIGRERGMTGLSVVTCAAAKPQKALETPETLLATSLIDRKATHHHQQRRHRAVRRAVALAA